MTDDAAAARSATDDARNRVMGAGMVDDPYPRYQELRSTGSVAPGSIGDLFGLAGTPDSIYWGDRPNFSALSYDECLRVLRDHVNYSSAWYELGRVHEEQGNVEAARNAYNQSLAADSKYLYPYQKLFMIAANEQKWDEVAETTGKLYRPPGSPPSGAIART